MSKLAEALAALGEIRERIERNDKRGYCCLHCETLCYSCEYEVPLLVAAVEEAGRVRPAVVAMLDEILALDGIEQPGPGENVAGVVNDALEYLRDRERQAIARAESAERAESRLRDEMGSAFRKHGLAAGPQAVDALVTRAEAAEGELADEQRRTREQIADKHRILGEYETRLTQSEAEVARLRELAAEAAEFIASDHPGLQDDVGELWAKLHTAWSAARPEGRG